MNATAVHPERILRDLNELWTRLAEDGASSGGVLRACAMSLVVAAQDEADADKARQTVGLLMKNHPSRAILLRSGGSGELEARVFAECWKPFGSGQQICAEGIEITTGAAGYEEVARFLVPLLVPDLPVMLWCRGARGLDATAYHALFPLASKIIFDSQGAANADEALRTLRRLHAYGYRVADLHWTRLTGWREELAHLFDSPAIDARKVHAARVGYGGGSVTTCARYFAAWLRTCLAALPASRMEIEPEHGEPGLNSVTLSTPDGDLILSRTADHAIEISGHNIHYRAALPSTSEEALMREELSIPGPDPVFERVLTA